MAFRPADGFWRRHLVIPLLLSASLLFAFEHTSADLWLADRWYALEGGAWSWRNHWVAYELIHHRGKQALIVVGLVLLAVIFASLRVERLRRWRLPAIYLFTAMAFLPALIALSKHYSPVPCPWDLQRFGGEALYRHSLDYDFGAATGGHCFPSGHASGGFALVALYFAALPYARRPSWFLLPGLLVGWTFALGQQARGAHFVSHDLWSLSFCWFGALGLFFVFRPERWAHPASGTASR